MLYIPRLIDPLEEEKETISVGYMKKVVRAQQDHAHRIAKIKEDWAEALEEAER